MIIINKGSDDWGVKMIVMQIVATTAAAAAFGFLLLLLLVDSFYVPNLLN